MSLELRDGPLEVALVGASLIHDPAKHYGEEIRTLLDRVWAPIRANSIANKGINWVVYFEGGRVFAGVEAEVADPGAIGLERETLRLGRHGVWAHRGAYGGIPGANASMKREMEARGLAWTLPMVEVYGHWDPDPSKLVTEIMWAIK